MIFNSFEFALFLPVTWALYWLAGRRLRWQNLLVVITSYVFYGWWNWRFLILIAFTSAWSFVVGLVELRRWEAKPSRLLLVASLVVNLGILGVFKYCNFFIDSFNLLLSSLHLCLFSMSTLSIILPVGVSFYTFQALSYTIDVYRRQIKPTRDPIAFFAFISFFPQLVAGPIERATNLFPQFCNPRTFDYREAVLGCRQMLWGLFKKIVVADSCASVANHFLNDASSNGLGIWIGVFAFTIQIYGDFSGYSDIAIGCSRLFGIRLMRNFAFPYFARDIAEFWRRWHISLTTWFRDYIYIPMGGSRCSRDRQIRNTFVVFLVSGLWHGANWTFVLWGLFHAVLFLPLLLFKQNRRNLNIVARDQWRPSLREFGSMMVTFLLVVVGWSLFRAQNFSEWMTWIGQMFNASTWLFDSAMRSFCQRSEFNIAVGFSLLMLACEWFNRREAFGLYRLPKRAILRWAIYVGVVLCLVLFAPPSQDFIYFQF